MAIIAGIEIQLRADIARLQRDMTAARGAVDRGVSGISRAADMAKMALASMGLGAGLSQIIAMSDQYTKFTAQLRLATLSTREYGLALADVKRIATTAQADLGAVGTLYARIANGTRELGISQGQVANITEVVNLALKVSGATAAEAGSAMLQLSQSFSSGTLRGEEFNAVNEAAPRLMLALADGMGVPVGALKQMATEGKITSAIMADVLPRALEKVREEAAKIQTISGAFQVLKNKLMEFTAVHAEANGTVRLLTTGIELLAKNLAVVMGIVTTLTAAKLATMFMSWATNAAATAAANTALATSTLALGVTTTEAAAIASAAKLAEARANTVAAASTAGLATARVAELRTAVLAAEGAVALAITTNGLIPAQARLIALTDALALSLAAEAIAARAATVAAIASTTALEAQAVAGTLATRVMAGLNATMAFFGGPVGLIITLLGAAATAWMWYGNKAEEANKKATVATDESTTEMISRLDQQIEKLRERNKIAGQMPGLKGASEADVNGLARAKNELEAARNGTGAYQNQSNSMRKLAEIDLADRYSKALTRINDVQTEKEIENRNKNKKSYEEWMIAKATKPEQMAAELKKAREDTGTAFTPELEARIRKEYEVKEKGSGKADAALRKEKTAYESLITSIGEKIAAGKLEMLGYEQLTESQKLTIKLDEEIKSGKNKVSDAHIAIARAGIAELKVIEDLNSARNWDIELAQKRAEETEAAIKSAIDEADKNEELARTFGLTKAEIEGVELARINEQIAQAGSLNGYTAEINKLNQLKEAKERSMGAARIVEGRELGVKNVADVKDIATGLLPQSARDDAEHADRLNKLAIFHDATFENEAKANLLMEAEVARHEQHIADIKMENQGRIVGMMGNSADQLYGMMKQAGMDQTALGKVAFLASKGLAVAQIILSTNVAAAAALALPPLGAGPIAGLPLAGLIKAMGYASAGMVAGLAIAEASAENGYDIPRGVNPVTQLHSEEMVLPRAQANVIRNMAREESGGSSSNAPLKLTIVNNTSAKIGPVTEQRMSNGDRVLFIKEAVAATAAQLGDDNSQMGRSMKRNFNVQRSR